MKKLIPLLIIGVLFVGLNVFSSCSSDKEIQNIESDSPKQEQDDLTRSSITYWIEGPGRIGVDQTLEYELTPHAPLGYDYAWSVENLYGEASVIGNGPYASVKGVKVGGVRLKVTLSNLQIGSVVFDHLIIVDSTYVPSELREIPNHVVPVILQSPSIVNPGTEVTYTVSASDNLFRIGSPRWTLSLSDGEILSSNTGDSFTVRYWTAGSKSVSVTGYLGGTGYRMRPFGPTIARTTVLSTIDSPPTISGNSHVMTGGGAKLTARMIGFDYDYFEWGIPAGASLYGYIDQNKQSIVYVQFPTAGSYRIQCRAVKGSQVTPLGYHYVTVNASGQTDPIPPIF